MSFSADSPDVHIERQEGENLIWTPIKKCFDSAKRCNRMVAAILCRLFLYSQKDFTGVGTWKKGNARIFVTSYGVQIRT